MDYQYSSPISKRKLKWKTENSVSLWCYEISYNMIWGIQISKSTLNKPATLRITGQSYGSLKPPMSTQQVLARNVPRAHISLFMMVLFINVTNLLSVHSQ